MLQAGDRSPLARSFLTGRVPDLGHEREAIVVLVAEDVGRDLDEERIQNPGIPIGKRIRHLSMRQAADVFHQMVGFRDQLKKWRDFTSFFNILIYLPACRHIQCHCEPSLQNVRLPRRRPNRSNCLSHIERKLSVKIKYSFRKIKKNS